jgi:predicted transcriptional regulator of viral defense system
MRFVDLLNKVSDLPFFTTRFLAAGRNLAQIRLQLSRWVKNERLIKLHKGLYTLAEPYRKIKPEPFCIANGLKLASYVSLQSALAWYGLIPEFVPVVTSVTTGRPQLIETPMGRFDFRHINKNFFWGYQQVELTAGQTAFIARPEKAFLDLVYLTPGGDSEEFIEELRIQNIEQIDKAALREFAEKAQNPKFKRALQNIVRIINRGEGVEL